MSSTSYVSPTEIHGSAWRICRWSDRSTTVRKLLYKAVRAWKLEHYGRLYGDGKVSLARAAKEAGVSLWEMMDYTSARKLAAQYDRDDLARDLKVLSARGRP